MVGASISEVKGSFLPNRRSILGEQVDGQERRPSQVEKVVLNPHRLEPQQVGPDLGQFGLDLGARRDERTGRAWAGVAVDQSAAWMVSRTCSGRVSSVAIRSNRVRLAARRGRLIQYRLLSRVAVSAAIAPRALGCSGR